MEFSVVICTRNRPESLQRTMMSLERVSGSATFDWEMLVVDNNSADQTKQVVEDFSVRSCVPVRYLFENRQGPSYARNRGIIEAKGDIIAFIDDDVVPSHKWLVEMKKAFDQNPTAACVGGKILLDEKIPVPKWWDRRFNAVLAIFDLGDSVILGDSDYDGQLGWSANLAVRRSLFEKYGAFREDLGPRISRHPFCEDSEFVSRLRREGELAVYWPRAVVYHFPDISRLSRHYVRQWYYGLGRATSAWESAPSEEGHRVFGIRRWRYRWAMVCLWRATKAFLTGPRREAFFCQLELISVVGYFRGAIGAGRIE